MHVMLTFLFGSYNPVNVISELLFSAALILLFRKCKVRPFWALVPFLRIYYLGRCADREPEGKVNAVTDFIGAVLMAAVFYMRRSSFEYFWLNALNVSVNIVSFIYRMRIYAGLCHIFDRSRWWIFVWLLFPFFPPAYWGLSSRFQPAYTVEEMDADNAARFSGAYVSELENGLTVNLEERTNNSLFEKKYLLRDIHLVVPPGHMVLLLGGSGAGKTTLINAINGYEKAKASVMLNGRNVYKQFKQIQYEIGYVPQRDLMRDHDTVFRTLSDAASLRMPMEADPGDRRKQVDEALDLFGLEPVRNHLVEKLSGGQRKRLSIAMEFIANPSLFILDEPDSGLDGVMARELMERLRIIADHGKIVIVITHTPDRVIDLFDDVIVLAKDANLTGRLAYYGSVSEAKAFFGKEKMEQIVMSINRKEEGGEGRADEFVEKYVEVQNA